MSQHPVVGLRLPRISPRPSGSKQKPLEDPPPLGHEHLIAPLLCQQILEPRPLVLEPLPEGLQVLGHKLQFTLADLTVPTVDGHLRFLVGVAPELIESVRESADGSGAVFVVQRLYLKKGDSI